METAFSQVSGAAVDDRVLAPFLLERQAHALIERARPIGPSARVLDAQDVNDDLALERIINTPKRGIGDTTVQTLYTHARAKGISLYQAVMDLTQTDELKPKVRGTLMKLYDDFERWKSRVGNTHHGELAGIILDESGYTDMWKADKSPEAPGRLENLKELVSGMEEFESLPVFLEHVALVMENQENTSGEMITIMTLHGAK